MTMSELMNSPIAAVILTVFAGALAWHLRLTMKILTQLGVIENHAATLKESVEGLKNDRDVMRWSDMEHADPRRGRSND